MKYRCLLFDLDGTLVDSSADLVTSVNLTLTEMGLDQLPSSRVMSFVGEGIHLLLERALAAALGRAPSTDEAQHGLLTYRRHYSEHLLDATIPYAHVESMLEHFDVLPKAVVTNKPHGFTVELLDGLNLKRWFKAIIGGDTLAERKPSPAPLLEAARRCGVTSSQCLMIGDSKVDMEAGRAAGMATCGFVGGFRGRMELVEAGADLLIETFEDLRAVVEG
jgi:phosphoglycolate phosphatase